MPEVERPEFRKDAKPTERSYGKCGSAFLGIALLGFAIRIGTLVNMKEGDNQRDQGESEPRLRKARALR